MLEALAHNQLKSLLQVYSCPWPHHLTLSRLVARALRRRDNSLLQLEIDSQDFWWLGLLLPLCLENVPFFPRPTFVFTDNKYIGPIK